MAWMVPLARRFHSTEVEGYGVDPDINVENDPKSVIEGKDPQLERAVAEVMKKLQTPVALPKKPAPPVKVEKRYDPDRRPYASIVGLHLRIPPASR